MSLTYVKPLAIFLSFLYDQNSIIKTFKGIHVMNLNDYKVTSKDQAIRFDNKGCLLVFKPTVGQHQTLEFLSSCSLPNIEYNKHFFRPKVLYKTKVLHETDELEIIDYKTMFAEELKQGVIEQHIGDGVIVTELTYTVLEDELSFLKRVLKELEQSLVFYSKDKHYATRFYLKEYADDVQHKLDFTQIVLENLKQVIKFVKVKLDE